MSRSLCFVAAAASSVTITTPRAHAIASRRSAFFSPAHTLRQGPHRRPFASGRHPHGARDRTWPLWVLRAQWGADVVFSDASILETGTTGNCHRLLVDIGGPAAAGYSTPGQFIQAKVDPEGKAGFFAIASPPDANNDGVIELLIKPSGEAAEALCSAPPGTTIKASPVQGKGFPIDRIESVKNVFIFATGSGISPIKALIESGRLNPQNRSQITLYYGARTLDAMAFRHSIPTWEKEHGIRIIPVFSEQGQGYVQDVFKASGGVEQGKSVAAVLCGQKDMAVAVTEFLTSAGVPKEHILLNF